MAKSSTRRVTIYINGKEMEVWLETLTFADTIQLLKHEEYQQLKLSINQIKFIIKNLKK